MEIISREEAKRLGLKRYFTGVPCKNGHVSERSVANWGCIACIKLRVKEQSDLIKVNRGPRLTPLREKVDLDSLHVISKEEAITQGLTRYYTGVPCKNGHVSERYISGSCVACREEIHRKRDEAINKVLDEKYPSRISREEAISKGLNRFFTGKPCRNGHIAERTTCAGKCTQCLKESRDHYIEKDPEAYKLKKKEYALKNAEKHKEYCVAYYKENKEIIKVKKKIYYKKNYDKIYAKLREWQKAHPEKCAEYGKITRQRDPARWKRLMQDDTYRLTKRYRSRIYAALKMQYGDKAYKSMELLGCTIDEFKRHLESTFTEGMSWVEFNNRQIEVDHIRPCASFDLTKPSEQKECFNWSNHQFLWAKDNREKGAKYKGVDYRYHKSIKSLE